MNAKMNWGKTAIKTLLLTGSVFLMVGLGVLMTSHNPLPPAARAAEGDPDPKPNSEEPGPCAAAEMSKKLGISPNDVAELGTSFVVNAKAAVANEPKIEIIEKEETYDVKGDTLVEAANNLPENEAGKTTYSLSFKYKAKVKVDSISCGGCPNNAPMIMVT